ncbi:F-box/kelch-repeat protein At3g06240-like [Rosa rugosa]|uniref:F-box/kelch-repeat protein At3g06240-like n=1 Tax=Rosa rugosa TaxID=74645 RepID=UPI002B40BAEA|nr:F-box/kelch-repeat protein At3g06240-like [Rosa rugosa]
MEETNLPEEIIVLILSWLPVKSLLRFTCVSKRFHFIILSNPKFAKSQFQAARERKTLDHRLLYNTTVPPLESLDLETLPLFGDSSYLERRLLYSKIAPRLESLHLETTSFGDRSSVRKLQFPFQPPVGRLSLLGSCNGIVFIAFDERVFYIWNPSTGFFRKLPDPGSLCDQRFLFNYGVGYLSATDDYKIFIATDVYAIFSSRAQAWKKLEVYSESPPSYRGTLLNEALHWLNQENGIVAFDLAHEKFSKMTMPNFDERSLNQFGYLGVSAEGWLSFALSLWNARDCIQVWVMKEYGVHDSWTKLFNFRFLDPPEGMWSFSRVLVLETSIVAHICSMKEVDNDCITDVKGLIKILHKEEEKCGEYVIEGFELKMIRYQESLCRIDD